MKIKRLNKNIIILAVLLSFIDFMKADSITDSTAKANSKNDNVNENDSTALEAVDIGESVIRAKSLSYSSGKSIDRDALDTMPSGNGDITNILKILPNVAFDTAQNQSTTPGEINPANISISGGLFYQNNFMLDGFNINNDLDPAGGTTNGPDAMKSSQSQGLNVDTSLLDSITVQDSNISAAYGGFSGGVVEANVRNARSDGWGANFSYQYTSDALTQYFINDASYADFYASSDESYQPKFSKHFIRASADGHIIDDLGLVLSFTTTQSFIPLLAYSQSVATKKGGSEADSKKTQKRQNYNLYIKSHYNPSENLTLEATLAYMPHFSSYYNAVAKNSYYEMEGGGIQAGLKSIYDTKYGLWSSQIGFSRLSHSRKSEANYFMSWFASNDKNWAINSGNKANEGGYGDIANLQNTLQLKSDFAFNELNLGAFRHSFHFGVELNYQDISKNRLSNYYGFSNPVKIENNATCPNTPDNLGLISCSSAPPLFGTQASWSNGQYFNKISIFRDTSKIGFSNLAYALFLQDEIDFDFKNAKANIGNIKARVGLRLDGDNYMDKITLAPRFSLSYKTPVKSDYQSAFTFGANRYYGRNLLSYRLSDFLALNNKEFSRTSPSADWVESPKNGSTSPYKFNKLNVPYSDEFMAGFTQNLNAISISVKYIHRFGKDEIMKVSRRAINAPTSPTHSANYTTYTNDGKSESEIISIIVENAKAIETYGIYHNYLFAFDFNRTSRTYNVFTTDEDYIKNDLIKYDGKIMNYQDRPTDNFALPFSIKLNTTHSFEVLRTRWMLNNFFSYRSGYERMVLLARSNPNYDSSFKGDQYGKMKFKNVFKWDLRLGFEVDIYRGAMRHIAYFNIDILNVLNTKYQSALSGSSTSSYASSSAVPIYELGRQFWLQIGYKF